MTYLSNGSKTICIPNEANQNKQQEYLYDLKNSSSLILTFTHYLSSTFGTSLTYWFTFRFLYKYTQIYFSYNLVIPCDMCNATFSQWSTISKCFIHFLHWQVEIICKLFKGISTFIHGKFWNGKGTWVHAPLTEIYKAELGACSYLHIWQE